MVRVIRPTNSSTSIIPSPSASAPLTIFRQASKLHLSPSCRSTCTSSSAVIFPFPSKSNTLNALLISPAFTPPWAAINSLKSTNPSPSVSIASNAFDTSVLAVLLPSMSTADTYSSLDILPSLFLSNLSNTRLISSAFGWKTTGDD
ncbi:hypothetical protein Hanom_Chr14g01303231 [Helianthus anomalus]